MLNEIWLQDPEWIRGLAALAVVAAVAYLAADLAGRLARAALLSVVRTDETAASPSPGLIGPLRIVRVTVFLALLAALALPVLDAVGVRTTIGLNSQALSTWLFGSGLRIVVIAVLTYVVLRVVAVAARRLEADISRESTPDTVERLRRARTLGSLIHNILTVTVVAVAVLMVLRELQLDITPILTSAGILGLAVGFGAQTLVKDLIAGFFLTLENQVRLGDVAIINGTGGLVEAINLRTIVLRDIEGTVHVFPNGSIERLANRTKDFSYYVIDVGVKHHEDPDEVAVELRNIGTDLGSDPRYRDSILEPLEILGIDAFEEAQAVMKVRIKTLPLKQWEVGRELRRRIKKAFDAKGPVTPTRHIAVHFGDAGGPFLLRQANG